ncbi:MAG TPA: phenylalanine--tRNA ligase subunit beta, partial [Thermomicrobiaceae bacterium]|nr:phenylalanine--tRNA ligase subunit beta [Thermomicrobiaceae bacterium]
MKVPVRWLKTLVPVDWSTEEIAHRLTMAGLEAESITGIGENWENVYVGHVDSVEPHPNPDVDRLVLATVSAGEHHLTVVTGAPNIREGQTVALALAGARLYDGHSEEKKLVTLKPRPLMGIRSEGMVCSEKELGLSDEHEGIMVLDADAPVGAPLRDYLGDDVIEFEITPNLVHAFSMIGIARELAALAAVSPQLPKLPDLAGVPVNEDLVSVDAPDLCSRYIGIVISGLKAEPSPAWMQQRLTAADVRPINTLVDVTNYVMLEFGQPLHAFDIRDVQGGKIIVRRARAGEPIQTIDHIERELTHDMLVIADESRAIGVAGVMGGVNTEIRDDTTTILLESANFDMLSVRHTARALRLRTDASARFERGLDPNLAGQAAARAAGLLLELNPGAVVERIRDRYPRPRLPYSVTMPRLEIPRLLGVDYPDDVVLDALGRLDFNPRLIQEDGEAVVIVDVPTYRGDVTIKADVVEEVARVIGYDTLPETLPVGQAVPVERDPMRRLEDEVQDLLVACGLSQIITYSMINEDDLWALDPSNDQPPHRYGFFQRPAIDLVTAVNPIRSDFTMMRPTLLASWLRNAAENLKNLPTVATFETAHVYLPKGMDELPQEPRVVCLGCAGEREPAGIYSRARPVDYFDAKGVVDELLERLGATQPEYRALNHPSLHPGRS